ncbi:MAG: hypothetical protein FK733_13595 [Asgard group archaeon]|nr:hypothetical protein [Asgard group archaeon]
MRLNKVIVVTAILLTLAPLVALQGYSDNSPDMVYTPQDFGDNVSVLPGTTLKYTINTLTYPAVDNLTIGDLTGNQIYVKVTDVEENYDYGTGLIGDFVWFDVGLLFTQDVAITIGEGFTAIDIVIPTGAATPAIGLGGAPHFNTSMVINPAFFVMDDGWATHTTILTALGFSIDVDDATELAVTYTNNTGSFASMAWRKSDGVLQNLIINNINFFGANLMGVEIDISLADSYVNGITLTPGEEILLNSEISHLDITGTGDVFSLLNQSDIDNIESTVGSMQDQTLMKFVINEVEGLYYTADVYGYDMSTQSLVNQGEAEFCAFFGGIQLVGPPPLYDTQDYIDFVAPVITADYDIYTGYMVLMDTIVGIYIDDILAALPDLTSYGITVNTIDGDFDVLTKRDYFFMQESINADISYEGAITVVPGLSVNVVPTFTVDALVSQEAWVAYSDTGYIAGMRMILDIDVTIGSEIESITGMPAGTISVDFDFKVVNPNFNPPDPIGGGIIPGYTWLISIPAIFTIAVISARKRRK